MKKYAVVLFALFLLSITGCTQIAIATPTTETLPIETTTPTEISSTYYIHYDSSEETSSTTTTTETSKPSATNKTTSSTTITHNRVTTGEGQYLKFKKGDNVAGSTIVINNKYYYNAYIINAPMAGDVQSGVIWPWKNELEGLTKISTKEILSTESTIAKVRTTTGADKTLDFKAGDTVVGWKIVFDNGTTYEGGVFIKNSPIGGKVTSGVINPWDGEITNQKEITP